MQMLPKSRRGTWLLAGAVWVAASAGCWWVLPVVPRAVMTLPLNSEFLGFGPRGETGLVQRFELEQNGDTVRSVLLELIEIPTTRKLGTLLQLDHSVYLHSRARSSDGRTWVFEGGYEPDARFWKVDLQERIAVLIPVGKLRPDPFSMSFSGNGRYWALVDTENTSLVLWDIVANKRRAVLEGLRPPLSFSDDGRFLAATIGNGAIKRIRALDVASLALCGEIEAQSGLDRVRLSRCGRYLIGEVALNAFFSELPDFNPVCLELATRARPNTSGLTRVGFSSLEDTGIGQTSGGKLQWRNLSTGETKAQIDIDPMTPWSLSPDHRLVVVPAVESRARIWHEFLAHIGINGRNRPEENVGARLYDASSGSPIGTLPAQWSRAYPLGAHLPRYLLSATTRWSPDSQLLATCEEPTGIEFPTAYELANWYKWELWDIPPRKSLTWFAAGAALLALPIALFAHRRVRKLSAA